MTNSIEACYTSGYMTARQRTALKELIRIFEKDGADLKIDVRMLTKKGKSKKRATIKVVMGIERGKWLDELLTKKR